MPTLCRLNPPSTKSGELHCAFLDRRTRWRHTVSDVRFYVGAAGAFGAFGIHTTTLLGSVDVTTLIVEEAEDPAQDYGHSDLFLADGAEVLVWQPILDWVRAH